MKMRKKLTVVGAGNVGATAAQLAATSNLADICLVDVIEGLAKGKALDLRQAAPIGEHDIRIVGTERYEETADSDLVIITAGSPRKPGMSRDDLLKINVKIVSSVTKEVVKHSPQAMLLIVSNPLDAMVYVAQRVSNFPRERVIGMAGVLDTARFRTFLAEALGCSVRAVRAFVLGGHGDAMVPLTRYSTMAGVPIAKLLPEQKIREIVQRTRDGGAEIVKYLKTGSAFYAPAAAAIEMADSILHDRKRVLPSCVELKGEYGMEHVFVGVPVYLGEKGMEKVLEIPLDPIERDALERSAEAVRVLVKKAEEFLE